MKPSVPYQIRYTGRKLSRSFFSFLAATIILGNAVMVPAQTRQLPIEDYLALVPLQNQGWQDPTTGDQIFIDAYGKVNNFFSLGLGTTVSGNYSVRNLSDGTQLVNVTLQTRNALCTGFTSAGLQASATRGFRLLAGWAQRLWERPQC